MSFITASIQSSFQSRGISEESYCAPWDLKIQEEKFKQISSSYKQKPFHRTYSVRPSSSRKKSFTRRDLSPPVLPPVPPGGLIPSCLNSLPKIPNTYDQPWDTLHGRSLRKNPSAKQHCSSPTFPIVSSCQYSDDPIMIPIDRYFWYHYTMSRRQAENVLKSRSSGSFLVRQSESGNHHDYSLSIQTIKGCVHMRISYSNGFYILGECSRPFASVSCMIKYFTHTTVPIRGATHIKLGTPVLRWEILSSSLSNEELL